MTDNKYRNKSLDGCRECPPRKACEGAEISIVGTGCAEGGGEFTLRQPHDEQIEIHVDCPGNGKLAITTCESLEGGGDFYANAKCNENINLCINEEWLHKFVTSRICDGKLSVVTSDDMDGGGEFSANQCNNTNIVLSINWDQFPACDKGGIVWNERCWEIDWSTLPACLDGGLSYDEENECWQVDWSVFPACPEGALNYDEENECWEVDWTKLPACLDGSLSYDEENECWQVDWSKLPACDLGGLNYDEENECWEVDWSQFPACDDGGLIWVDETNCKEVNGECVTEKIECWKVDWSQFPACEEGGLVWDPENECWRVDINQLLDCDLLCKLIEDCDCIDIPEPEPPEPPDELDPLDVRIKCDTKDKGYPAGEEVTVGPVTVSGGSGNYKYEWFNANKCSKGDDSNKVPNKDGGNTDTIKVKAPDKDGDRYVCRVTDEDTDQTQCSGHCDVLAKDAPPLPDPLEVTLKCKLDSDGYPAGDEVEIGPVKAEGGSGKYEYQWWQAGKCSNGNDGNKVPNKDGGNTDTIKIKAPDKSFNRYVCQVTDKETNDKECTEYCEVRSKDPPPPNKIRYCRDDKTDECCIEGIPIVGEELVATDATCEKITGRQWQKKDGDIYKDIKGETSKNFTPTEKGEYRCKIFCKAENSFSAEIKKLKSGCSGCGSSSQSFTVSTRGDKPDDATDEDPKGWHKWETYPSDATVDCDGKLKFPVKTKGCPESGNCSESDNNEYKIWFKKEGNWEYQGIKKDINGMKVPDWMKPGGTFEGWAEGHCKNARGDIEIGGNSIEHCFGESKLAGDGPMGDGGTDNAPGIFTIKVEDCTPDPDPEPEPKPDTECKTPKVEVTNTRASVIAEIELQIQSLQAQINALK